MHNPKAKKYLESDKYYSKYFKGIMNEVNGEIVISEENISIKKGNSKSINISLASPPTNSQIVNINCNNNKITVEPSQLTFNSSNYSEQQAVTISVNSSITESSSVITVSSTNVSSKNISLQIIENEPIAGDNITSVTNGLINSYDFSIWNIWSRL